MEDWFERRLAEQKALEAQNSRIYDEAPRVHGELWKEITRVASEAKAVYFHDLIIQPDEVVLPVKPRPKQSATEPRTLCLELTKDRTEIVAHGASLGRITLSLDIHNQQVKPKYEGTSLSIPNAARLILDPFFFPELKREDIKTLATWANFV